MTRATTIEELRARHGDRYKWLVLLTVMVGMMGSILSSTIVNVAVPDLSHYFMLSHERAQWVAASFMMSMMLSLLTTPWLLGRYGMRRTFIGANLLLAAGGLAAGFTGHFNLLIAMRVVEGLAAGVLQVLPNIVIMRAFAAGEQGRATGIFGFGVVMAPALGPSVGGVLVEHFGWRSIFFSVIPFCAAAIWLTRRYLPMVSTMIEAKKPLDWLGVVWIGASAVGLLNGLVELQESRSVVPAAVVAASLIGFASFVLYQLRAGHPLLNVRLFAHRQVAVGAAVAFAHGFAIFGSTYLVPVFLQTALGYTPSQAGMALLPAGLALALVMPLGGRLADRHPPAPLVTGGLLAVAASFVLTGSVEKTTAYALVLAWILVGRIGIGIMAPALTLGTLRGLAQGDISQAASINAFVRQFGGAAGISIIGSVLHWRMMANGGGIEPAEQTPPYIHAFEEAFWFLAAFSFIAGVTGWFLRPSKRHTATADKS
jgi:DHA2 family multidrug resistance protein